MNKVVHFEIPFDDKERAMSFYKNVFGWEMQDVPDMSYVITRTVAVDENFMPKESGAINGGFYERDDKSSKTPVLVIDVPSIDEHVALIKKAGGEVVREKMNVGNMGYYAQVKDTEGNIIGIWENIKQ